MKHNFYFPIIILLSSVCILACTEVGPPINLTPDSTNPIGTKKSGLISDSSYTETTIPTADSKRILIEEFSGQSCSNCPNGHDAIEQILASNNRVSATTIHFIDNTFPQSLPIAPFDFRTESGTLISKDLDGVSTTGIPAARFDRVMFSGAYTQSTPSSWVTYVNQEMAKSSTINLELLSIWDDAIKQDSIALKVHFTSNNTDTLGLSLYLVENNIIASQLLQNGSTKSDYIHNNIFRGLVHSSVIKIAGNKSSGNVKLYQFRTKVIDETKWNVSNMKIIAFVFKENIGSHEIIQVAETKLK
ncbi:MAG: hypothetical protein RL065_2085 [Bacteroidota bacterium]|jgi:hypothetical protein